MMYVHKDVWAGFTEHVASSNVIRHFKRVNVIISWTKLTDYFSKDNMYILNKYYFNNEIKKDSEHFFYTCIYIVFWEVAVFGSNFIGLYRLRWQPPLSHK